MPSIHVNPEELRSLSHVLEIKAREMQDEDFRLRQAGAALDMAWTGGSSGEFQHDLELLQHHLRVRIQEVYSMANKLSREADRWEESDQTWVQEIRRVIELSREADRWEESDQTWVQEIRRVIGSMFRAGGK